MSLRTYYNLLYIDVSDVLRPPGLDVLVLLVASLGSALVTIQPVTSPVVASRIALDPTLFAAALFLAVRGSAGMAYLIQSGIINTYLTYPIGKVPLAVLLALSRVFIPSLLVLGAPLLILFLLLGSVMLKAPEKVFGMYTAFFFQASLYGLIFLFFALRSRSQSTSGLLSVSAYFAYTAIALILPAIGRSTGNETLTKVGEAMYLPEIIYSSYMRASVESWQILLVPSLVTILFIFVVIYFWRRFEVI
ncbi:MAG: hypothetical protein N3F67_00805 [Acidilobaceae archaeon]|nr:hypothetical protein [Acidilobaceae archaeon]